MREIKFRDYEPILKQMRYFDLDSYNRYEHDSYGNIMQYTGLKDKNGKEIYEGDIVDCYRGDFFQEYVFQVIVKDIRYLPNEMYGSNFRKMIVIGNIHETPELL